METRGITRCFLPPTGGSPAQAHHRLKRTHRQLTRTRAAEKFRNNSSLLSRVAVPYTRLLFAKDARGMREKECEESIEAMEIRIEMRRKRSDNKRQREEEAIAIAERKRARAAHKLLGIATPRYRKPK